ncbi:MAG: helix-turn-helix transcriptional regulator [Tenacibaculum sp.]|nr:helix-turn-helix transcriptional regulator [Tenacibaculum sp.]
MTLKKKKLTNVNKELDKKYGKEGTPERNAFREKAMAWYYGEILKEKRKELKITQVQLAEKTGLKRSYISRVEQGNTDIQLSSLLRISQALGLQFGLI